MVRRKRRGGLALPWERGVVSLREVLFGRQMRPAVAIAFAFVAVVLIYSLGKRNMQRDTTLAAIAEVNRAVRAFLVDMDRCPRSGTELVHPPKSGAHYLSSMPTDAWSGELTIECTLDGRPVVSVMSAGPSGSLFIDDNLP